MPPTGQPPDPKSVFKLPGAPKDLALPKTSFSVRQLGQLPSWAEETPEPTAMKGAAHWSHPATAKQVCEAVMECKADAILESGEQDPFTQQDAVLADRAEAWRAKLV